MAKLLGMTRFWNYISDWIECRVHLRPEKDSTLDLGASDYRWRGLYVDNLYPNAFLNLGPGTTLVVASDAITATGSRHYVDTEGGAGTDNLATINGGVTGDLLVLSSVSYKKVTTLKDGTGNLDLAGDFALSSNRDMIMLMRIGGNWQEISRSNNA